MTPATLCRFAVLALAAVHAAAQQAPVPETRIEVVAGTTTAGEPTAPWLDVLRKRLSADQLGAAAAQRKPPTPEETGWEALIRARAAAWERMVPELATPYAAIPAPASVRIVLGNRGGDDAFTHDATTLGFDLAKLQALYGDAALAENAARMDRLFRHEFSHIMQKPWLARYPWAESTPLRVALLDIWTEGLGNYYSLSAQWSGEDGARSAMASRVLADLEPRFVARLAALSCASAGAAPALLAGLSSGPFDKKWGAIPAALWLKEEPGPAADALSRFVFAGPDGVWDLAMRHLPSDLQRALAEARALSACASSK